MRATPTVLIVEDDRVIAMDLEEMAIRLGWRVVGPVHNLEDAMSAATVEKLDYALLDFNLSADSTSIPVAEVLRGRAVSYCFVTSADPAEVKAANNGAKLVTKPISVFELQRILEAALP